VLTAALTQAKDARMTILNVLNAAIDGPDEMAPTAPRVISVQIPVDKIGELIGPKGKTINAIQDETGADISIEEDGTVFIACSDAAKASMAKAAVEALFNVVVTGVNTITQKGKTKRWKGAPYRRSDMKKAIVTLKDGQSIDVTQGVNS